MVFAKKACKGDYYFMQGRSTGCLSLRGDISTDLDASTYCRYKSSSDDLWTACADGPLRTPGSWESNDAVCSVYSSSDCTGSGDDIQSYTSVGSSQCQAYSDYTLPEIEWNSVKCETVAEAYNE
ncbi:glycoside hydrolase family 18 protein [Penicillium verhagenii]|nr:glycoside hydrolase family 18 protein [Penicillium verhagenii]